MGRSGRLFSCFGDIVVIGDVPLETECLLIGEWFCRLGERARVLDEGFDCIADGAGYLFFSTAWNVALGASLEVCEM